MFRLYSGFRMEKVPAPASCNVTVIATPLAGVMLLEVRAFGDARGYLFEAWQADNYAALGLGEFRQDNFSRSKQGILRGLHYQLTQPQGKLVTVARGAIWDVCVDIRVGSPTYGKWFGTELSDQNHRQLWIPPGFAHGFYVLSDEADVAYKCTTTRLAGDEYGVAWNDPELAIDWPTSSPILSDKDAAAPHLRDAQEHLPRFE